MRLAIRVLVCVDAAVWLAFVVLYAWRSRWWRSPVGRNQMALPAALGLVLALVGVSYVVRVPRLVWVIGLAAIGATGLWRIAILWRIQRQAAKDSPADRPGDEEGTSSNGRPGDHPQ